MAAGTFDELRKKLEESKMTFPYIYMFKFIVKSENRTIAMVEAIFDNDAEIMQKESAKGNYLSITVKQVVMNIDEIITIYEKAAEIKGVMSL